MSAIMWAVKTEIVQGSARKVKYVLQAGME